MGDEAWVTCPYERAHRVPAARFQRHLVKCEARHPPLAICPYNATHRMAHAQLPAHVQACPTRDALCAARAAPPPAPLAQPHCMAKNDPDHEVWD